MKTVLDYLLKAAEQMPDSCAYRFLPDRGEPVEISYSELDRKARAIAARLQTLDAAGSRVLLVYPNSIEFVAGYFGCLYAAAVPCPAPRLTLPVQRTAARIRGIVRDSTASIGLAPAADAEVIDALQAEAPELASLRWLAVEEVADDGCALDSPVDDSTLALLQYTSGSTTTPRGVMVSHANLLANLRSMDQRFRHSSDSVMVSWLPTFHDMGLIYGVLIPLYAGITGVLMTPAGFIREPRRWLEAFTRYRGTHAMAPNFAFARCVDKIKAPEREGLDLSSWRFVANASEPIRAHTMQAFRDAFEPHGLAWESMGTAYGLAETTLAVSGSSSGRPPAAIHVSREGIERDVVEIVDSTGVGVRTLVSSGHPLPEVDVAIADPQSCARLGEGQIGEIWVAGDIVAGGYLGRPDDSDKTFRARLASGEGPFLRTGDLGFLHGGELFVASRCKDLIIIRGDNHHPEDIEETVQRSARAIRPGTAVAFSIDDGVQERLVIAAELPAPAVAGIPAIDDAIRAAVALEHGLEVHDLVYLEPRSVPRTSSGKVQRAQCRREYMDKTLSAIRRTTEAHETLAKEIAAEIARQLRVAPEEIATDAVVSRLGLDSVKAIEVSLKLERQHGLVVPSAQFSSDLTIAELTASLVDTVSSSPDRAPVRQSPAQAPIAQPKSARAKMEFSLFFFANDGGDSDAYRLLLESTKLADNLGFHAAWVPERHFHAFGGVYPNPSVAAAAIAATTSRLRIRAGSVVLPLHDPIRVAEEWSLVDNLSRGRVDLAFAAGWAANDFVLKPENYAKRKELNLESIETVRSLWRGESLRRPNGLNEPIEVRVHPRPIQPELDCWLTCSGPIEGFIEAGRRGLNVLTALLFQSVDELAAKLTLYRQARAAAGHDPDAGVITLMLHTFVADTLERARREVREPFTRYLRSSVDLWRHQFPHLDNLGEQELEGALDVAFERYFGTSALFGTPSSCFEMISHLVSAGVSEIACLIDFGVETNAVLASMGQLDELRRSYATPVGEDAP